MIFGPLSGAPRLKMADFEVVFGTLETGYLQEKNLLVVFDRPWAITFIFVIWGSWGLTFGSRPSLYEFSLFLIPGPPAARNFPHFGFTYV